VSLQTGEGSGVLLHLNRAEVAVFRRSVSVIEEEGYDKKKCMVAGTKIFTTFYETPLSFSNAVQNSILQQQYPPEMLI
jgi:hypothetical protein